MKSVLAKSLFAPEMSVLIAVLYLVEFVRGAALISFLPIYGKDSLGMTLGVVGAAITANALVDTAVKLVIGYLLHRYSVRLIVSGGLVLSLAGVILLGMANEPWLFVAAAGLYGIGLSPIWIVCLTRTREHRRGTQMGVLYTIWLVGLGSGPVVANFLLERSPAAAYTVLIAASALAWLLSLFIPRASRAEVAYVPFRRQLALLADRLRGMSLLLPGMVLQTLAAGMLMPVLPSFATDRLGMSAPQYSLLLFVGGGFTAAALIPMGKLSDAFGKKWFLVTGFCLFGLSLFALTRLPSLGLSLFWAFVLGVAYAAVLPAWNSLLAAYVPPGQSGLGWGVFSTVEGVGGLLGPVFGGVLASNYGEPRVVGLAGAIFMVISLFYLLFSFRLFGGETAAGDTVR